MTAIKTIALIALALMLASVCVVRAQLPATNPLVVPPLPPSPPAQLAAPVSTAIAPSPLAVPSLPAAFSTPGARLFNCSCSGPGQPTHWMGQVTAASYLSASQSASGACTSYTQGKVPSNGTAGGIGAARFFGSLPAAQENAGAANGVGFPGQPQNSTASTSGADAARSFGAPSTGIGLAGAQVCSNCVCD